MSASDHLIVVATRAVLDEKGCDCAAAIELHHHQVDVPGVGIVTVTGASVTHRSACTMLRRAAAPNN